MELMIRKPNELNFDETVFNENIRVHQIGGITDGMSPEVAADIGFHTPEQLARLPELPEIRSASDDTLRAEGRGIAAIKGYLNNLGVEEFGVNRSTASINKRVLEGGTAQSIAEARQKLSSRLSPAVGQRVIAGTVKRYIDEERILGNI